LYELNKKQQEELAMALADLPVGSDGKLNITINFEISREEIRKAIDRMAERGQK